MTTARIRAMASSDAISCQIGSGFLAVLRRWAGPGSCSEPGPCSGPGSCAGSAGARGVPLLLDLGGLAAEVAQVVELRAAHVTAGDHLDVVDDRRVQREGPLDAHAEGDLADGEGAADPGSLDADADTLEDLQSRAVALDDLDVHLEGVAGAERGKVVAPRGSSERVDDVGHGRLLEGATGRPRNRDLGCLVRPGVCVVRNAPCGR